MTLSEKHSDNWRKTFGTVVKIAFYVSKATFSGNFFEKNISIIFFPDFERKMFRLLAKNFRQGCQNCILRIQRYILGVFFGTTL